MNREDITILYYIAPLANVPSIMRLGILSHQLAQSIDHNSLAMREIQERRQNKQIPGAGELHQYANLYFDAHNPMLSKIRNKNDVICVLQVSTQVLELSGVIISDLNAAADFATFYPVAEGLRLINKDRVFSRYWNHPENLFEARRHKKEKCSEVLVPDCISPKFIVGAYVANETALAQFQQFNIKLPVSIKSDIFF